VSLPLRAHARLTPARRPRAQAQQISLNFHCKCEQFVHFATGAFFNFNGTAGAPPPPRLPSGALMPGALAAHRRGRIRRIRQSRMNHIRLSANCCCF
jgi:hypothetical protein